MAALAGYRRLIRTAQVVFKNDTFAITQAKIKLREEFLKQKDVTDKATLTELFKGIDDVDEMLRFNIVQGTLNERGNYDMKITEENQVTVGAHQDLPGGAQLEPVDASRVGGDVTIDTVKNRK
mmetsp:Transcript_9102/g.15388  ORF Transcript_9102/g.15388 Transcript_9102/m.15388 type:complete len:123 (-) Transcript_9102:194-562(-)